MDVERPGGRAVPRQTLTIDLRRGPAPVAVQRELDGATITACGAAVVKPLLEALVDALSARRDDWVDGLEVETGWCVLRLVADESGFVVQAPRFDDDPHTQRTTDLTVPLSIQAAWERVGRATDSARRPVRFDEAFRGVVGWERHSMLTMTRAEPIDDRDSGWLVEPHESAPGSWDVAQQERLEAWMVHQLRPAVVHAAALPAGLGALIQDDDIRLVVDPTTGEIRSHLIR